MELVAAASSVAGRGGEMGLRCCVTVLCVVALMMMVRDRQLVVQSVQGFNGAANNSVATQLRYSDSSGLIFLVYSNALVAIYSFVVLALSCTFTSTTLIAGGAGPTTTTTTTHHASSSSSSLRSSKPGAWALFALDQVLAYTLLSASSTATEVTYLVQKGDLKTLWDRKCQTFGHYCHMLEVSIIVSFVAVLLLGIICVLSARQLFQKYAKITSVIGKMHAIRSV